VKPPRHLEVQDGIRGASEIRIEVVFVPPRVLVVAAQHVRCERMHGPKEINFLAICLAMLSCH